MEARREVDRRPAGWLLGAALVVVVGLTYANVWRNEFVFDDQLLIVQSRAVRAPLSDPRIMHSYRPLRTLSYRVDYAIGGMRPRIFHVANVTYHALTVLLVCAALQAAGASPWAAAAGALLFAVHPVQTDAVTYAAGRRDVLCGLFYVAGFLAFLRWRARPRPLLLVAGVAAGVLAVLAKEMAVTLPLACLAFDRFAGSRRERSDGVTAASAGVPAIAAPHRRAFAWAALLVVAAGGVFVFAYGHFVRHVLATTAWHGGSVGANFATVARIWAHYLHLLAWPATLSADYSYDAFPVSSGALDPRAWAALALLAFLATLAWRAWRRGNLAGFGAVWYAVALLPVSHFVPYSELLAEHYLYVPMVGVAFVVAGLVDGARAYAPERRRTLAAIVLVVVAAAATRTIVRNRDWRDTLSLWSATVAAVPGCARAHFNLGQAYFERVRLDDAEREWLAADAIRPRDFDVQMGLATLYYRLAQSERAMAQIDAALAIRPDEPHARALAGWITLDAGDPRGALTHFAAAVPRLRGSEAEAAAVGQERASKALEKSDQGFARMR
jgi:tetratricopeptide (TPR) repeat protein